MAVVVLNLDSRSHAAPLGCQNRILMRASADFCLSNGLRGEALAIMSANPTNFHQAISDTDAMPRQELWGKLFLPEGRGPFPVVIIVPGSLGLQQHHVAKAESITDAGIAACAIDPFGPRGVVSTVDNQIQFSFAASAWDVLATTELLAAHPEIDESRIGAQGHSRGGSAVLGAASVHLAAASSAPKLVGVYAAYPWSGHQFLDPAVGGTRVRAIIGDLDEWCSPMQVQAHIHSMRAAGCDATMRLVRDAHHSFDRATPLEELPHARVAPAAPTVYIADDGAFVDLISGEPDPALVDLDGFLYAVEAGYGVRGAHIAGGGDLPSVFIDDMMTFWNDVMALSATAGTNKSPRKPEGH